MKKIFCFSQILFFGFFAIAVQAQTSLKTGSDIEAGWKKLYAEFDYEKLMELYDPVFEVEVFDADVDKANCEKNYDALLQGVKRVPVSISLNYWTYRCAGAIGKTQDEEFYLQNFSLLAKHAFDQASDFRLAKPIRVMHSSDIFALVHASGNVLADQYLSFEKFGRYLPWVVVLHDKETKRQRTYEFDFVDLIARLSSPKIVHFRVFRVELMRNLIKRYNKQDWQVGVDAQAALDFGSLKDSGKQMELLKPLVLKEYKHASDLLLSICLSKKDKACGEFMIDAMLDALERKDTAAMVRMSALYAAGVGVKQDADAAIGLLKSAEQLSGDKGISLRHFAALHDEKNTVLALPAKLQQYLEAEAFNKNKPMLVSPFISMMSYGSDMTKTLQRYGERMGPSAEAGNIDIYNMYSVHFLLKDDKPAQMKWLEAAAKAGHARAQLNWAEHLLEQDPDDLAKAEPWMLEAAQNGEFEAIQWLVDYYYDREKWKDAAGWAESGLNFSDLRSGLQLAYIYALEPEGTDFTEADAVQILEAMVNEHDSAKARNLWVRILLKGKTYKHDPVKAKAMLLQDAEKNDVEAMILLGSSLLSGNIPPKDEKAGMAWLEKAAALDSKPAKSLIAYHLYKQNAGVEQLMRAKKLWTEAVDADSPADVNNFAWTLCTSNLPAYRDGKAGLKHMQTLDLKTISLAQRDTYAACLAASGDFKEAVIQQQQVVDAVLAKFGKDDKSLPRMRLRLDMYQKSQTYTETPADL